MASYPGLLGLKVSVYVCVVPLAALFCVLRWPEALKNYRDVGIANDIFIGLLS